MNIPYRGHCPICKTQLQMREDSLRLECPAGHYICGRDYFEEIWGRWDNQNIIDAEILLQELLKLNEVTNG